MRTKVRSNNSVPALRIVDRQLHTFSQQSVKDCELGDRMVMSEQILAGRQESIQLNCFRATDEAEFWAEPINGQPEICATTRAGLLRAAVADFLFNYKWATQYPHDFIPDDLTQSAQELNTEFNPLTSCLQPRRSCFYAESSGRTSMYIRSGHFPARISELVRRRRPNIHQ